MATAVEGRLPPEADPHPLHEQSALRVDTQTQHEQHQQVEEAQQQHEQQQDVSAEKQQALASIEAEDPASAFECNICLDVRRGEGEGAAVLAPGHKKTRAFVVWEGGGTFLTFSLPLSACSWHGTPW